INELTVAARKVAEGDFSYRLNFNRKDEIGKIAESFNFMIQKLQENQILQQRLREAEHLSAIGELSRIVTHEIRNPLNFISLSIDHLIEKFTKGGYDLNSSVKLLQNMKHEIHRVNSLITEYLEYTKPLKLNRKPVSIVEMLEEVLSVVEPTAEKYNILIHKDYLIDFILELDIDLFKSCLMNVILNAIEAMKESNQKTLFIKTELVDDEVVIKIIDTGVGIPEELKEKIFEPFFTTKKHGLGLGLPLAKKVIEEHGGRVEFLSKEKQGSEFRIYLSV
ncbi:MAG: ATP-binding protein, partial [Thermodesulfovibrionaceae bacterium]